MEEAKQAALAAAAEAEVKSIAMVEEAKQAEMERAMEAAAKAAAQMEEVSLALGEAQVAAAEAELARAEAGKMAEEAAEDAERSAREVAAAREATDTALAAQAATEKKAVETTREFMHEKSRAASAAEASAAERAAFVEQLAAMEANNTSIQASLRAALDAQVSAEAEAQGLSHRVGELQGEPRGGEGSGRAERGSESAELDELRHAVRNLEMQRDKWRGEHGQVLAERETLARQVLEASQLQQTSASAKELSERQMRDDLEELRAGLALAEQEAMGSHSHRKP